MKTDLIGVSSNIEKIKEQILQVAATGLNTVVCGETGVGKELVVKMLFEQSPRFGQAFVKVNCAALPDTLLESEMFGYEQGAFTGAIRKMRGKFEQANGGLLFLDEIGDMAFPLQAKLLHALQDGEFTPLGSENSFQSNVWIIAATNHNLKQDLKEEKFRADLYYRLDETTIHIEPLRNRPEDIPFLIKYYGDIYVQEFGRKHPTGISNGIIDRLCKYHWPGNVRELQNVLRRIIILNEGEEVLDTLIVNNNSKYVAKAPFRREPVPGSASTRDPDWQTGSRSSPHGTSGTPRPSGTPSAPRRAGSGDDQAVPGRRAARSRTAGLPAARAAARAGFADRQGSWKNSQEAGPGYSNGCPCHQC